MLPLPQYFLFFLSWGLQAKFSVLIERGRYGRWEGGGVLGGGVMRNCYVSGLMLARVVNVAG